MDSYEIAYENFRNKRMKPKQRGIKMENEVNEASIYDQAATLYREGKTEEAFNLIKENLGEEAAEQARVAIEGAKAAVQENTAVLAESEEVAKEEADSE